MTVTAKQVQDLRKMSGAGMMDCKAALAENNADIEKLSGSYASTWLKTFYGVENQPSSILDMTMLPPKLIRRGLDFEKISAFITP